jgi:hypothetical protein
MGLFSIFFVGSETRVRLAAVFRDHDDRIVAYWIPACAGYDEF